MRPLVVDLDGTLIRSDLLIETAFAALSRHPVSVVSIIRSLFSGKAALKHLLASDAVFDAAELPYDPVVIETIRSAREAGRPVWLASASNARLVEAVSGHLGLFDGWIASDEDINLSGRVKADRLVKLFGKGGFDYIGNSAADLPVWEQGAIAITIRTPPEVVRQLGGMGHDVVSLPSKRATVRTWLKQLRVHQYAKNALIFVPILTSHAFTVEAAVQSCLTFVAFSMCASSIYILNDLLDLSADRAHPSKCARPLASGLISPIHALAVSALLGVAGALVAALVSLPVLAVLLAYLVLTTAYSMWLKRKMLVDVVTLAMLYAIRVLAGAVAISVVISEWLIPFALFMFTALALIKRYVELSVVIARSMPELSNRNYKTADLPIVAALAAASGFNAVTVFALYVASDAVRDLYTRPDLLWLFCPLLIFWFSRMLMMAHRGLMHDDPIVFALSDRVSHQVLAACTVIVLVAL